jgi:hypothetical protein
MACSKSRLAFEERRFARVVTPSVAHEGMTGRRPPSARASAAPFQKTIVETVIAGSTQSDGIGDHFARLKR